MDASVGFAQSLDNLQGVEQLVRTFDPQQLLPAKTLTILETKTPKHSHCVSKITSVVTAKIQINCSSYKNKKFFLCHL